MRVKTIRLVENFKDVGIVPIYIIDSALPVYLGIRDAGAFNGLHLGLEASDGDYADACHQVERDTRYRKLNDIEDSKIKVGYSLEPVLSSGRLIPKIFMFRGSKDKLNRITDMFSKVHSDVKKGRANADYEKVLLLEGEVLGFPDCCSRAYARDKQETMRILKKKNLIGKRDPDAIMETPTGFVDNRSDVFKDAEGRAEKRARKQLNTLTGVSVEDEFPDTDRFGEMSEHTKYSYFTSYFYPCKPECDEAGRIGQEMLKKLSDFDTGLEKVYEALLNSNKSQVWESNPEYLIEINEILEKEVLVLR